MALVEINNNMNFNNLNWHDSIIEEIIIDRTNPGKNDTIQIVIIWPNGKGNLISFKDVYWANLDMNFGVISSESILSAFSEGKEHKTIVDFYKRWKGMIDDINLNYYEIETSSTRSKIRVIAKRIEILEK